MTKCEKCKCKCCNKKIDISLYVPEGMQIGEVEIFEIAESGKRVGEFKPGKIEHFESESECDSDYQPSTPEEDPYENLPLTDAEKKMLKDELAELIMEQAQHDEESN